MSKVYDPFEHWDNEEEAVAVVDRFMDDINSAWEDENIYEADVEIKVGDRILKHTMCPAVWEAMELMTSNIKADIRGEF